MLLIKCNLEARECFLQKLYHIAAQHRKQFDHQRIWSTYHETSYEFFEAYLPIAHFLYQGTMNKLLLFLPLSAPLAPKALATHLGDIISALPPGYDLSNIRDTTQKLCAKIRVHPHAKKMLVLGFQRAKR